MNSSTASFEVLPFRSDGEAQSEEVRRRVGGISARSSGAIGPRRGSYRGPHRPPYGQRRPIGGYGPVAVQASAAPDYTQAPAGGAVPSEQIRWVQFALNQITNAGLPTDGIASPDFRAALRDFQGQQGLPVRGFAGPDTIAALRRAGGSPPQQEFMIGSPAQLLAPLDLPSFKVDTKNDLVTVDVGDGRQQILPGVKVKHFNEVSEIWYNKLVQLQSARAYIYKNMEIIDTRGRRVPVPTKPGQYIITFGRSIPSGSGEHSFNGKEKAYHGTSGNLSKRIRGHATEVAAMGFSLDGTHDVRWLELQSPYNVKEYRNALDKCIDAYFYTGNIGINGQLPI